MIRKELPAEERFAYLNNILYTIRGVNQLIIREKDCGRLIQGVCALIKALIYCNALTTLLDKTPASFSPCRSRCEERPYPYTCAIETTQTDQMRPAVSGSVRYGKYQGLLLYWHQLSTGQCTMAMRAI